MGNRENDNQLILELCRFVSPDSERIMSLMEHCPDWGYVLGQLIYHRVGSAAYKTMTDLKILHIPNREFVNGLRNSAYCDRKKSESMAEAIALIGEILKDAEIPYALLKGSYLAGLYEPGLRSSNDIDILIRQCDLTQMENILMAAGFEQGYVRQGVFCPASRLEKISTRMNRGETIPFIKKIGLPFMEYIEIDLNFSLDFKATGEKDTVEKLLKNAKKLIVAGENRLYTLEQTDFFIHLCAHLYKEAATYAWVERDRDLSLYKFLDLYFLIDLWYDNYECCLELAERIKSYGLLRECFYSILYTLELFPSENRYISWMLERIRPEKLDYLNEVYDPTSGKVYRYGDEFMERIFRSGRRELCYED